MRRILIVIIFLTFCSVTFGQKYFSLGSRAQGICFGNSQSYHGLRFNFWDYGVALSGLSTYVYELNGVSLALCLGHFRRLQGVSIAAVNKTDELYGVEFGLINYAGNNCKWFR